MSTYSTGLRTELQVTGANSGTWGTITNNNFSQVFEFAIAGVYAVPAITTGTSTTLTNGDGPQTQANNQARNSQLVFSGTVSTTHTVQFPATQKHTEFIITFLVAQIFLQDWVQQVIQLLLLMENIEWWLLTVQTGMIFFLLLV